MGPGAFAARSARARERITTAATTIASRLHIEPAGEEAAARPRTRDIRLQGLLRDEETATLLEAIAAALSPTAEIPTNVDVAESHTARELIDLVASADADELDRLEAAEQEGKNRKTVFDAIEKRRIQLLDELPNEAPE